jgi:hypothetical protein
VAAGLGPQPRIPGDGKCQVSAIRLAGLREIEARVIVEEGQREIAFTAHEVEPAIDARVRRIVRLGAAFVGSADTVGREVTGVEARVARNRRGGDRGRDHDDGGGGAAVQPYSMRGDSQHEHQAKRVHAPERESIEKPALRRQQEVSNPDQQVNAGHSRVRLGASRVAEAAPGRVP